MKKLMTIAMVALLAVSTVFAGFSGSFTGAYTADLNAKTFGYGMSPKFKLTFDATTASNEHESDVYASVGASVAVKELKGDGFPKYEFKITEASLNGANWKINLAGAQALNSYAAGFVVRDIDDDNAATQDLYSVVQNASGITGTYADYTVAAGLEYKPGVAEEKDSHFVVADTKKFEVTADKDSAKLAGTSTEIKDGETQGLEGLRNEIGTGYQWVKADKKFDANFANKALAGKKMAGNFSKYVEKDGKMVPAADAVKYVAIPVKNGFVSVDNYSFNEYEYVKTAGVDPVKKAYAAFFLPTYKFLEDKLSVTGNVGVYATGLKTMNIGLGANVAYAEEDALNASVGIDAVVNVAEETTFDVDVLASVAYGKLVSGSVYFATNAAAWDGEDAYLVAENLLDVKVATDLAQFNVPVALTLTGKDLVNDGRGIALDVTSAFMEGASVSANFGMTFNTKAWEAGLSGEYTLANVAKFSAGVELKGVTAVSEVSFNTSIENTSLIEDATLKLAYESENFLDAEKAAGVVTASVAIEF